MQSPFVSTCRRLSSRLAWPPSGDPLAAGNGSETLLGPNARAALPPNRSRYVGGQTDAIYLGDQWGLRGVKVRSTQPDTQVTVRIGIDEYADLTEETFTLACPGTYALYPRIRLQL